MTIQALGAGAQSPGALGWITLTDTRGISIWNYEMSIDRGGVTSPGKVVWSVLVDTAWAAYQSWVALALWFLDWVVGLSWLSTAAAPFITVGDAMQGVVTQVGAGPTFLTVTFLAAVLWIARGRWATGVWELVVSLTIGALALGMLANPIHRIAGEDGWIAQTQQAGQEMAVVLTDGDETDPGALSKTMVDVFIRLPAQLVNFGAVLDGGECEQAYTNAVRGGPYGDESDIRDAVAECDEDLGDHAANPSIGMAADAWLMVPGAGILVLLIVSVAGSVLAAGLTLLWEGAKGAAVLLVGVLPGAARGPLWATVGTIATRLALLFVTSIFLGLTTLLVAALLASGDATAQILVVVDVILVVCVVVWRRQRAALHGAAARVAAAMAWRPGGAARLPAQNTGQAGALVSKALQLAQLAATRRAANAAGNIDARTLVIAPGRGRVPPPPGRPPGRVPPPAGPGPGGGPRLIPPAPGPGDRPGPSSRRPGWRGRPVADAALLLASGGTGTVAKTAVAAGRATAARKATKSALQGRLGVRPEPLDGSPAPGPIVQGRVVETHRP